MRCGERQRAKRKDENKHLKDVHRGAYTVHYLNGHPAVEDRIYCCHGYCVAKSIVCSQFHTDLAEISDVVTILNLSPRHCVKLNRTDEWGNKLLNELTGHHFIW